MHAFVEIGGELEVTGKKGGLVRGTISIRERVGVITGAKRRGEAGVRATLASTGNDE